METHKLHAAIGLVVFVSVALLTAANAQTTFALRCHPFQKLEVSHPIDTSCKSAAGNATPETSGHALQNAAKNNFCAEGQPVDITAKDLLSLQTEAAKNPEYQYWDRQNLPSSRDPFTKLNGELKEGTLVRYTGFIYELHAADVDKGESVNCNTNGAEANDIHIAFVADPAAEECASITAEMSPHFRPKAWAASNMAPRLALHLEPAPGEWVSNASGRRLSRVTGQLMFDAAHKPCTNGRANTGDPARASDWEVHPVYAMEVCKTTGAVCADADWQPLDQFLSGTGNAHRKKKPAKTTTTGSRMLRAPRLATLGTMKCASSALNSGGVRNGSCLRMKKLSDVPPIFWRAM